MTTPATARPLHDDVAWLRILAIAGVVLIHVTGQVVAAQELRGTTVWDVSVGLKRMLVWCVPVFVVVSGRLAMGADRDESVGRFYRTRLSRLVVALAVWHLAYFLLNVTARDVDYSPASLARVVFAAKLYTALYFFWIVAGLYVVAPWLVRALRGCSARAWLAFAGALCAATWLWTAGDEWLHPSHNPPAYGDLTILTLWLPYVGYFVAGAALARVTVSRTWAAAALAGSALLLWLAVERGGPLGDTVGYQRLVSSSYLDVLSGVTSLLLVVAAAGLVQGSGGRSRPSGLVHALGARTLGVFGVHLLVLYGLVHTDRWSRISSVLELVELYLLTVGISYAFALVGSRLPVLRRIV